jgi:hypothetical protein
VKINLKNKKKKHHSHHLGEKRCEFQYKCIDGNWTWFPAAYCEYYDGVLTVGLMKTHRCRKRKCPRLQEGVDFE